MQLSTIPLRRLLPALALLSSLALTSCFDKDCDPKPRHQSQSHGKCGTPPPAPAPSTGGNT